MSLITLVGILFFIKKKATEHPYFRLFLAEDVTIEEGRELANKLDLTYVETVIDDRKKVEEILRNLAKKVLDSIKAFSSSSFENFILAFTDVLFLSSQ